MRRNACRMIGFKLEIDSQREAFVVSASAFGAFSRGSFFFFELL